MTSQILLKRKERHMRRVTVVLVALMFLLFVPVVGKYVPSSTANAGYCRVQEACSFQWVGNRVVGTCTANANGRQMAWSHRWYGWLDTENKRLSASIYAYASGRYRYREGIGYTLDWARPLNTTWELKKMAEAVMQDLSYHGFFKVATNRELPNPACP